MNLDKRVRLRAYLDEQDIPYEIHEHPPVPTVEEALPYWKDIDSSHCKNLFFRNHKGNKHYLVILDHRRTLNIRDLEQRLKQGKISFASPKRMDRYLGVGGGSVSAFGIINDIAGAGFDIITSASAVASSVGNVGPGLGAVGPTSNYALVPDAGKWLLSFLMIVGRLEIFPVILLFTRELWRR